MNMNTEDIGNKIEQFRQYLTERIIDRGDLLLNSPDPSAADFNDGAHLIALSINREFTKTFPTESITDEQTGLPKDES